MPAPIVSVSDRCPVCGTMCGAMIELPDLPITGLYSVTPQPAITADQGFCYCVSCGHGFLRNVVDPQWLYQKTYTHRSSQSPIATSGNDFLLSFIRSQINRKPERILEVGCNDLYLLTKLAGDDTQAFGIDPIWAGQNLRTPANIHLIGGFVADAEIHDADLIVSAHTFEHMADPAVQLRRLVEMAKPGADFFLEVPSLDTQIRNARFDQVFHQHLQYFSLASMQRMIANAGAKFVSHTINHRYWGGTLLVHFRKCEGTAYRESPMYVTRISEAHERFKTACSELASDIKACAFPVYGYGAAQMLPILAYHLKLSGEIKGVIDDHPDRTGKHLVGLSWPIIDIPSDIENAGVVVTALDSQRPILKRLLALDPRVIFRPLCSL
jgi:2-polyprenyl-3-methyl-5-hydroxy-6-metoxy-1,4-benzoquinol methylase